ncbi:hypothetical protein BTO05_12720 [Winogradskyella sp. PC-19]|uniref:hypothetical protein n=1 Tax=unclassified Winogradskyella TaxID=2615021 RepID=UPI000B3D300F|nr:MULTISPECIES: hypothetical protein [unclassified Winogradskyella]ARV10454.1 hypothetical protein BTO05_12720 [Winogradskyella sp. PC-19]
MKRDIRELFEKEDLEATQSLAKNHRKEFLQKLESEASNKSLKPKNLILKIAAIFIIALMVGYFVINKDEAEEISPLVAQIEAVEMEYLESIQAEWINFIKLTDDENLVKRYEKRLNDLDYDYQVTSENFKKDPNNILVVESLITNLQTRLQLLKDIQKHIKILNQKNEQNENTI